VRFTKLHPIIVILVLLSFSGLLLAGCSNSEDIEAETLWQISAHADAESGSFTRWDDEDPAEIPENCAKCHSTPGYLDFLGADGSASGQVDQPAPVGTTVECEACHNEVSTSRDEARMPSSKTLTGLGKNSDCMECHQGRRASGVQVDEAVSGMPADEVNTEISAPSLHNNAAGPTRFGAEANGGYEYQGQLYASRYPHVAGFTACIECHNAHSLKNDPLQCSACHLGVINDDDFASIRSSSIDYDSDGDISEGMAGEIETMEEILLRVINRYVEDTEGVEPIVINRRFTNEEGDSYTTWTPRLLRAAFNYQYSILDVGGYAHHPHYTLQLLYDSIEDLGGSLSGLIRP